MTVTVNALLIMVATVCLHTTVASLCEPRSTFKIDCNNCTCSVTGKEYLCTKKVCPPINYKEKYFIKQNKDGYVFLKPKDNNEQFVFDDDNEEFVVNKRHAENIPDPPPYPYIKDTISEGDGNEYDEGDDLYYDYDYSMIDNEKENNNEDSYNADLNEPGLNDRVTNWKRIIPY